MAYYISFLKTLSLKLNGHTIHFFYNEVSGITFFEFTILFLNHQRANHFSLSHFIFTITFIPFCCYFCVLSLFLAYQ